MPSALPDLFTLDDLVERYPGITREGLVKALRAGLIAGRRVGETWLVTPEAWRTFLEHDPVTRPAGMMRLDDILEVAPHLSRDTLYDLVGSGELRGYKIGRAWHVDPEDWRAFVERRKAAQEAELLDALAPPPVLAAVEDDAPSSTAASRRSRRRHPSSANGAG